MIPGVGGSSSILADLLEIPILVRRFEKTHAQLLADALREGSPTLMVVGEGSARIFPGGRAFFRSLWEAGSRGVHVVGCREVSICSCSGLAVLLLVGQTSPVEMDELRAHLARIDDLPVILAPLIPESSPIGTRSVVAHALLVDAAFDAIQGDYVVTGRPELELLASEIEHNLSLPVPTEVVDALAAAETIWFCGSLDGVAEELALKGCEMTGKRSVFAEGSRLLYGAGAAVRRGDAIVLVEPNRSDVARFVQLGTGVGATILAIAGSPIPGSQSVAYAGGGAGTVQYLQLVRGWRILVQLAQLMGK